MPTLRYLDRVKRKRCEQSLGRSKMKRDRIMQNLAQEDNKDDIEHLQKLLKDTEKAIVTMQRDAPKSISASEVICCSFVAHNLLTLFCDYRCTRCWMSNSPTALGQYPRRLFYYTCPSPNQNQNEQVRTYYVTSFLGIKSGAILAIGTFGMSLLDPNGRKCCCTCVWYRRYVKTIYCV